MKYYLYLVFHFVFNLPKQPNQSYDMCKTYNYRLYLRFQHSESFRTDDPEHKGFCKVQLHLIVIMTIITNRYPDQWKAQNLPRVRLPERYLCSHGG